MKKIVVYSCVISFFYVLLAEAEVCHAQKQAPPGAGIYRMDTSTPLAQIPYKQYLHYFTDQNSLNVRTVPHAELQGLGTRWAVVASRQDTTGTTWFSLAFLNETPVNAADGFKSTQTKPVRFFWQDSTFQMIYSYAGSQFENQRQMGLWYFRDDRFSLYKSPESSNFSRYDSLSQQQLDGIEKRIEAAWFSRTYHPKYLDIHYNAAADSIPIYRSADDQVAVKGYIGPSENIFVLNDSLRLWLQVSKITLVPDHQNFYSAKKYSSKPEIITGWIKREDLYRDQWVRHMKGTEQYRFEVAGKETEDNLYRDHGTLKAIKVINKGTGETTQIITDIGAQLLDSLNKALQFPDANFDGYPDIMTFYADGGAGPNYSYAFFLYNPQSHRFTYHEKLSSLPQVNIDPKEQIIRSAWRAGAADYGREEYTFHNDTLSLLSEWNQHWISPNFATEYIRKRQGEMWKKQTFWRGRFTSDTVAVFDSPGTHKTQVDSFLNASNRVDARIIKENPLWYYVEATDFEKSKKRKGWVHKETIIPRTWQTHAAQTPLYAFQVPAAPERAVAVKVIEKASKKPIQIIAPLKMYSRDSLETGDYNFDGQPDFRFLTRPKSAYGGSYHDYYLYNRRTGVFHKDSLLSTLPALEFESSTKTVISTDKKGTVYRYRYTGQQWKAVKD